MVDESGYVLAKAVRIYREVRGRERKTRLLTR